MSLCKRPFVTKSGDRVSCGGHCIPCRLNRRRLWTHRLILEAYNHEKVAFVTLTYNQENYPKNNSLVPKDVTDFLKRLRKQTGRKIRYYVVGEYGDRTERPHYHMAIYGVGPEEGRLIEKAWGKGFVYMGDITEKSAQYIANYVTKRMTRKWDERLKGRYPEFARMSRKPGLGADSLMPLVDGITQYGVAKRLLELGDIPNTIRHGKKELPLGRYLKEKVRELYGFEKKTTPKEVMQKIKEDVQRMREAYESDPKNKGKCWYKKELEDRKQKILNLETRYKIYKKGGIL